MHLNSVSAKGSARAQALTEWLVAWKVHKTNWFIWIICCKWNNTTVVQNFWTSLSSREIYHNRMENQPSKVDQVNKRPMWKFSITQNNILFGFIIMHNLYRLKCKGYTQHPEKKKINQPKTSKCEKANAKCGKLRQINHWFCSLAAQEGLCPCSALWFLTHNCKTDVKLLTGESDLASRDIRLILPFYKDCHHHRSPLRNISHQYVTTN